MSKGLIPDDVVNLDHDSISALFLGPKAENFELLKELFGKVLDKQRHVRENYHREDNLFITDEIKKTDGYNSMVDRVIDRLDKMTTLLNDHSVPFFSPRYSAHMCTDMSLPGILGYLSTMIFNPNNVAFEASPITTVMELEAGKDMCRMLGYNADEILPGEEEIPVGWGHISCDGTIANLEAIWAARNLKFYPLALRDAMADGAPLHSLSDTFMVPVTGLKGQTKKFADLELWELLNLTVQTVNDLPGRLYTEYGISPTYLDGVMKDYNIQSVSKDALERRWGIKDPIQILITSTKHYSWPKGAAIAGIGSDNVFDIDIDDEARINVSILRSELEKRLEAKRAVYMVVAVIGSTEEGAVDPLGDIIALRDEMESRGMSFVVHADAAWGGYFASMIRDPSDMGGRKRRWEDVPSVHLREETAKNLAYLGETDSITIDPHKAGYIPYPAGGLCYRDGRQRYLLTWTAPYLNQSSEGESIGVYGVEGSKPGASAGAVFLAHSVIGLHKTGYGNLLGEASFNCRRFAAHWSAMSTDKSGFVVVPFNPIPAERKGGSEKDIEAQKDFIRKRILPKTNQELEQDTEAMDLLNQLGSDLNINLFACNFRDADGNLNTDIELANHLNWRIFQRLSVTDFEEDPSTVPFYITSTKLAQKDYKECATNFKKRLGVEGDQDVFVLRNVVMSPFASADNFVKKLADIFKEVLVNEIGVVRQRALPMSVSHNFLMQGREKLYFVHMPSLYRNGEGYQTIFTADIDAKAFETYKREKEAAPDATFILQNIHHMTLEQLLRGSPFKASISIWKNGKEIQSHVDVSNLQIVKQRTLRTTTYDADYPHDMPFYLYGTPSELHLDHIYLLAPNIQLTAGSLRFSSISELSAEELARGMIAVATEVHEDWMQPFPKTNQLPKDEFFFRKGKTIRLSVYKDPYEATYDGKIDLKKLTNPVTTGEAVLTAEIFVDSEELNKDSTYQPIPFRKGRAPVQPRIGAPAGKAHKEEFLVFNDREKAGRWHKHFSNAML